MGFDISHQHVGLNRVGVFLQTARTKGPGNPTPSPSPFHREGRTAAQKLNEPWRRVSNLVGKNAETRDHKLRKRGAKLLFAWIGKRVCAERDVIFGRRLKAAELTEEWASLDADSWKRVELGGRSVDSFCAQLGISRARLTGLFNETLGLSAIDVVDGFKIRGLRKLLIGQLREAALSLWDAPGEFAKRRCMGGEREEEEEALRAPFFAGGPPAPHKKRRRYFRTRAGEFLGLEDGADERLRVSELLGKLDALREENDFRIAAFALRLGFDSSAAFRKACLNVTGRTLEQLERVLAHEIVAYYLAAEDRELREIAGRDDEFGFRAREIYGCGEESPCAPFLDRWSACETAKPAWVAKMREEFG